MKIVTLILLSSIVIGCENTHGAFSVSQVQNEYKLEREKIHNECSNYCKKHFNTDCYTFSVEYNEYTCY